MSDDLAAIVWGAGPCHSHRPARAWSVVGALAAVALEADGTTPRHTSLAAVEEAVMSFADTAAAASLREWNDAPRRTQDQVVAAFERALDRRVA